MRQTDCSSVYLERSENSAGRAAYLVKLPADDQQRVSSVSLHVLSTQRQNAKYYRENHKMGRPISDQEKKQTELSHQELQERQRGGVSPAELLPGC